MIASVAGVDTPLNMDEVDLLNVNDIELFENGTPTVAETELFTLEGNQTKMETQHRPMHQKNQIQVSNWS